MTSGAAVLSDLAGFGLKYLTQAEPALIFPAGPDGARPEPVVSGETSVRLDDMVCRQFPRDYRGVAAQHFVLKDALVVSGLGSDGLVVDSDGMVVAETAAFSRLSHSPASLLDGCPVHDAPVEKVALFFDSAWTNYYHFLLFGIGKYLRLSQVLPPDVPTLLPALEPAFERSEVRMTPQTVERMLDLTMRKRPTLSLQPGAHRVGEVHLFWPDSHPPTDIFETQRFLAPFRSLVPALDMDVTTEPRRRLMIRRGGPDPRMGEAEAAMAEALARDLGFETLTLEDLTFDQQVAAFAGAEAVIAPHGAGLANLVFADPSCQIVELNRRIGGEDQLRPWFYQLAAVRGMPYAAFDMDKGPAALEDAFRFLSGRFESGE